MERYRKPRLALTLQRKMLLFILCFSTAVLLTGGQVEENSENSCVAAGFTSCCFFGDCQSPSGCFCDRRCYTRGDCCQDIPETCSDACTSSICFNGNCSNGVFTFVCDCPPGYTGRQCEINIDDCVASPCQNGQCMDDVNSFTCLCDEGFSGENCEINVDDCLPDVCQNNGICVDGINSFTCDCPTLFAGLLCENETQCTLSENQCMNNGICQVMEGVNNVQVIACQCPSGFSGSFCEQNIDECLSTPCQNNGTCTDRINGFICTCSPGFTGPMCEIDIDLCTVAPCVNNALCREADNGMINCFCRNGFTGNVCQTNINDCARVSCQNGGTCLDRISEFTCDCTSSFVGEFCSIPSESHPCALSPCLNNGTCIFISDSQYVCVCADQYTGANCSFEVLPCQLDPCQNAGTCINMGSSSYECVCPPGITGMNCSIDIDECDFAPCMNGGSCLDGVNSFSCSCLEGFTGTNCEVDIDDCQPESPCQNNATCIDRVAAYSCDCLSGFTGLNCETNIDDCEQDPCNAQGTCMDGINSFSCLCDLGFTGATCNVNIPDCVGEPCGHGGSCIDRVGGFECVCTLGFTGVQCMVNINDCASAPCFGNASCIDGNNSFSCMCSQGFTGDLCDNIIDFCMPNPCGSNGECSSTTNGPSCSCATLFTGEFCEIELGVCDSRPCFNNATCVDMGGEFTCECPFGFSGPLCDQDIDFCQLGPCSNNGTCISLVRDYRCECAPGYTDVNCGTDIDECSSVPCQNEGICMDLVNGYECLCQNGFSGLECQLNVDDCVSSPCLNAGTCIDLVANYQCNCPDGYGGINCELDVNLCDPQPCMNGANCTQNLTEGMVNCFCSVGFQGLICESDIDECADESNNPCQNGATCTNTVGAYTCQCSPGFTGTDCEFNAFDDCNPSLCLNGATCVDHGPDFNCLCAPGYTGIVCEIETDECIVNPCMNGGRCVDEFLNFTCSCVGDFSGRTCAINLNPCSSTPCSNGAICVNGEPGSETFSCDCTPGFTGDMCNINIDDCVNNSCLNGASCEDGIDSFICHCTSGFGGNLCEVNIFNDCAFDICLNGGDCIDVGDDFACVCKPGFTGEVCEFGTNECLDNPCFNGGTCRDLIANYTCFCSQGFTGNTCEINIDDCAGINCNNGGCVDGTNSFSCVCDAGFTGDLCDTNINECLNVTCMNAGVCQDLINGFTCECLNGFTGLFCEDNINDCVGVNCSNNGQCVDLLADFVCQCDMGYTGENCEMMIDDCLAEPCFNNATCMDLLNNFTCACSDGFEGRFCEVNIDDCINVTCLNGGTCLDLINGYQCDCLIGYVGETCEINIDDCVDVNCNNGRCVDGANSFSCVCGAGFAGAFCDVNIDECLNVTCGNGGFCQDLIDGFTCECLNGFSGQLCEDNINDCVVVNCSNNGQCVDLIADFVCQCDMGYTGENCEMMIDDCLGEPCFNNAICMDLLNSFTCACSDGFEGRFCEVNIDDCVNVTCLNGGTCSDLINDFECDCLIGYVGAMCEINIDDCADANCNNGRCVDGENSFSCVCGAGFAGAFCGVNIDECLNVTCGNGGFCQDLIDGFTCECLNGFSGQLCEDNINDCLGVNCSNNGQCVDLLADFVCQCDMGYTGENCEMMINDCLGEPCFNNATCMDLLNNFTCVCSDGFEGQFCEVNVDDCVNVTCLNGGTCLDLINGYQCDCLIGYLGVFCETRNFCEPSPCLNSATCTNQADGFTCDCGLLYTGEACGIEINLCADDEPCLNNGLCTPIVSGGAPSFECSCMGPYSGLACATFDPCVERPCLNDGLCVFSGNVTSYECVCSSPFLGRNCEIMDVCAAFTPCLNGASCTSIVPPLNDNSVSMETINGTYECICAEGFTGGDCEEIIVTPCSSSPCENEGVCTEDESSETGFVCSCSVGFLGDNCSEVVTVYSLSAESYLTLNVSTTEPSSTINLNFALRTNTPNGVVLYIPGDSSSYILLRIVEYGYLSLEYKVGSNPLTTVNSSFYGISDSLWHTISVSLNNGIGTLSIDNRLTSSGPLPVETLPFPRFSNLYFGRVGNVLSSVSVTSMPGFVGCLDNILVNGNEYDVVDGMGITQCQVGPCTSTACLGRGVCMAVTGTASGFTCECNLGYTGDSCDQELDISVPSFRGNSYLLHSFADNNETHFSIDLTILTNESNGLLLFAADNSMNYLSIVLRNGFLELFIKLDTENVNLDSFILVNDGLWHTVSVSRNGEAFHLTLDGTTNTVFSSNTQFDITSPLFLGGIPFIPDNVYQTLLSSPGFIGCIRDLKISGVGVDIVSNALSGADIGQCSELVCSYVSCQNGATCLETVIPPGFQCSCQDGFMGEFCEAPIPLCMPNPCNGGICSEQSNTFSCLCPLESGGRVCDEDINITIPEFSGNSYIAYPRLTSEELSSTLTITLRFYPVSPNGLLLFVSYSDLNFGDFFSLALIDRTLQFSYSLGAGVSTVSTSNQLELNAWYIAMVTIEGGSAMLFVNGQAPGFSTLPVIFLNLRSNIWLGGYSNFINITGLTGTSEGFNGSVSLLEINGRSLDLILGAEFGYGVTQSETSTCVGNPCLNGGQCVESGPSFVCVCTDVFTGPLCGSEVDPCVVGATQCGSGSTCQAANDGVTFTCLCRLGRGGDLCDQDVSITTPSFNMTSYLEYNYMFSSLSQTSFEITFNPSRAHGLILHFGSHSQVRDFISLTLINSRVQFRFDLGSGVAMLTSSAISLDMWHTVYATRNGRVGTLRVDNEAAITATSPGSLQHLPTLGNIQLGGVGDINILSPHTGTEIGYEGCIGSLKIDGQSINLVGGAINGRFITECTSDLCSMQPCANGGTCQLQVGGFRCTCTLGYTGETCNTITDVTIPNFNGISSYISYPAILTAFATTTFRIELRPLSYNGLILYTGQQNGPDYIALLLRNGFVELWYDLGQGSARIVSRSELSLDTWHTIEASRSGRNGFLAVDDLMPTQGNSVGTFSSLQVDTRLFLGGVPYSTDLPSELGIRNSLNGCVRLISVQDLPLMLTTDALEGADIDQCLPPRQCEINECQNGGVCVETSLTNFICNCLPNYSGVFCETQLCNSSNLCENNGLCSVSAEAGNVEVCSCSLPYGGDFCTERESFTEARISSSGFLQYGISSVAMEMLLVTTAVQITFTLPPSSAVGDGQIFFMGAIGIPGDYTLLRLQGGYLIYQFELGRGTPVSLMSRERLEVNRTYSVDMYRDGNDGTLSVNGQLPVTGTDSSAFSLFNLENSDSFGIFLGNGGEVVQESSFEGCISQVSVGHSSALRPLQLDSAQQGQLVTHCNNS